MERTESKLLVRVLGLAVLLLGAVRANLLTVAAALIILSLPDHLAVGGRHA
jgi:hypothetical protein